MRIGAARSLAFGVALARRYGRRRGWWPSPHLGLRRPAAPRRPHPVIRPMTPVTCVPHIAIRLSFSVSSHRTEHTTRLLESRVARVSQLAQHLSARAPRGDRRPERILMPRRADLTSIGMGRFARRDVIANDRLVPSSVRRMAMVLRRPSTVETNTATAPERPVVRTASRSSPAGGPGILESGEVVHRLTDQVIHAIDHRIIAERERLGRL